MFDVLPVAYAGMMTGRHQVRFGIEGNPPIKERNYGVPTTEPIPAERLNKLGYTTGLIGKWHLGCTKELTPLAAADSMSSTVSTTAATRSCRLPSSAPRVAFGNARRPGDHRGNDNLTTALGREAVNFVDRHHRTPFFLCLSFTAEHKPLEATEADLKRFPDMKPGKRKTHAAMTVSMDDAVGKLLASLHAHDLEKNTLIIFISDNGVDIGPSRPGTVFPLTGPSGTFEGGNRVPFAMQWTGRIPAGKVYEKSVSALDILPTSVDGSRRHHRPPMEARRRQPHALPRNGTDKGHPHETLYWRIGERKAIRHGNWKMIHDRQNLEAAGTLRPLAGYRRKYRPRRQESEEAGRTQNPLRTLGQGTWPAQVDTKYGRL